MKKILGLDLGTTSIGWALVNEAQNDQEKSNIIKLGVRVVPLTTDEENDFQTGKSISVNADRTLKRGSRRNFQRYKQRRAHLIKLLTDHHIIDENFIHPENGKQTTHSLLQLRAKAAAEEISLNDLVKVLLHLNKKRGYKSNRKVKEEDEGNIIDSIDIARILVQKQLTPGQYVFKQMKAGSKQTPEFYQSDLQREFDKIWTTQRKFYPEVLTAGLKQDLYGKNKKAVWAICEPIMGVVGVKRLGNQNDQLLENYKWRCEGLTEQLPAEHLVIVFQELLSQINNSSGYLGQISDRSKQLSFNDHTIGQFLYKQLELDPNTSIKNQVFYRQDYLNEFNRVWEIQSKNRKSILTNDLRNQIRDTVIFYQRRLKSQKGTISICELEGKEVNIEIAGNQKKKIIGPRVIPKSSPLFQEFKIWQIINNIKLEEVNTGKIHEIKDVDQDLTIRNTLFNELNQRGELKAKTALKICLNEPHKWQLNNYESLQGNETNKVLYKAYEQIAELSGHQINKTNVKENLIEIFDLLGMDSNILHFNAELQSKAFEQQAGYQIWHLLYSYEGDDSTSGNDKLITILNEKFGFNKPYAKILASISFNDDYGNLSAKAIKRILPYLKAGHKYSEACELAGYNHSHSMTSEENNKRTLEPKLDLLARNSLRNPVVEKILNQMVNVINAIIDKYGKPEEIRIEMSRDLKKSAKERAEATKNIARASREHEQIKESLKAIHPFKTGVRITRNDIIKYKLWEELATNGYKTIYTDTYVPLEKLFTNDFDVEHIIPKALLFDDSFSNKTLATRDFNRIKSNKTGLDAIIEKYGDESDECIRYKNTIERLYNKGKSSFSRAKYNKLLMSGKEIPDGFIDRDLRNTQYISKKAQEILKRISRTVIPTTGSVTNKLREDWQLVNVLQELNWDKFNKLELTSYDINKEGKKIPIIKHWSKRNDHRHHAMDALTVAFTKPSHIQYLNYLNARKDEAHSKHKNIYAIEQKETFLNGKNKRIIKPPIPIEQFRKETLKHLGGILVSHKAKNKVVTRNQNKTKRKNGYLIKTELTPRGQLHKETVYGSSNVYETKWIKIGPKLDHDTILKVKNKKQREALLKRLKEFEDDPKKAFGGKNQLSKNPIFLDEYQSVKLPEKIKMVYFKNRYTIRKEITPELKIEKIVDHRIKRILQERLAQFSNDPKLAFTNLTKNPIWLNKSKGIAIKSVTISGVNNAEALHYKKDNKGAVILNDLNQKSPSNFVSTGNNHHIAIYQDKSGDLHEEVVSFYLAVSRYIEGVPVVNKSLNDHLGWKFLFTLKQNEFFVFPTEGFDPSEINLLDENNYNLISPHLFRVQKIASKNYVFNHHLETKAVNNDTLKNKIVKKYTYNFIQAPNNLKGIIKVRLNHLGFIVKIGEY